MRYRELRAMFNGKTIESAVCADLGGQLPINLPYWIELKFTDGTAVRLIEYDGSIDVDPTIVREDDLVHRHSRGAL